MKKRVTASILAGVICLSAGYTTPYIDKSAQALTLIATMQNVSVSKNVIAIGETVQLNIEWSTGAEPDIYFSSSDESVLTVDSAGIVTGVGEGVATVTLSPMGNYGEEKTIEIAVSSDVEKSIVYNTSELTLGTKLKKCDTLHYDEQNIGSCVNVVNANGSYDVEFLSEGDYLLPFNAEVVGINGLVVCIAPEIEGVTYIDGRTLSVGDVVDETSHLLCYDYKINDRTLPVFLPSYYKKYIGTGTIKVKDIDHEQKTITLESVGEKIDFSEIRNDMDKLLDLDTVTVSGNQAMVTFNPMINTNGCCIEVNKVNWGVYGTAKTDFVTGSPLKSVSYDENYAVAYCLITADSPGTVRVSFSEAGDYIATLNLTVDENGNFLDSFEFYEPLNGDVNGDDSFNVADAVIFQKWLLNKENAQFGNYWEVADLCKDGQLNVFDLCMMKRKLFNEN